MFIPLGTTLDTPRRPLVVFTLVAVNVLLHVAVFTGTRSGNPQILEWFQTLKLSFRDFHWWEPFSYQFLHDPTGIMHVAGNMIFLLAFGGVVENRLGKIGFLALYLVGGALSGLLQVVLTGGSVIGASGSVSGWRARSSRSTPVATSTASGCCRRPGSRSPQRGFSASTPPSTL